MTKVINIVLKLLLSRLIICLFKLKWPTPSKTIYYTSVNHRLLFFPYTLHSPQNESRISQFFQLLMPVTSSVWYLKLLVSFFATNSQCVVITLLEDNGCCEQLLVLPAQRPISLLFHNNVFLIRGLQIGGAVSQGPLPSSDQMSWCVTTAGPIRHSLIVILKLI